VELVLASGIDQRKSQTVQLLSLKTPQPKSNSEALILGGPMNDKGYSDDDRPFTPEERKQLRDLLQADQRRAWVISTVKQISIWLTAVAAAIAVINDIIKRAFHSTP
jgi:hypothetical protein